MLVVSGLGLMLVYAMAVVVARVASRMRRADHELARRAADGLRADLRWRAARDGNTPPAADR